MSERWIDREYNMDLWTYCTNGDVDYVEALCTLLEERLAQWDRHWSAREYAICFSKALLPARCS